MSERTYTDQELIELLEANRGNKAACARALNIRRGSFDDLVNTRPDVLAAYQDLREELVDRAETNIFNAVEAGDKGLSQYVVATLGKNRGWAGRQELTGKDGEELAPAQIVFAKYEDDSEAASEGE